jgi:H+/Cl- antiporter ClcA
MTKTQRYIGVGGAVVFVGLLLYPPWRLEYEGGYSRIAYQYVFSPPDYSWTHRVGDRNVSPQTTSVAAWMLLGELAAAGAVVGFLLWLYRPTVAGSGPSDTAPPARAGGADGPRG